MSHLPDGFDELLANGSLVEHVDHDLPARAFRHWRAPDAFGPMLWVEGPDRYRVTNAAGDLLLETDYTYAALRYLVVEAEKVQTVDDSE